jgi:organic radical activating enzyme
MTYQVAERFKSIQGEGVYAGTPMAFIRFVGCSVGKKVCQHCDTDFEKSYEHLGGGEYSIEELFDWAKPYQHICLTGGEPLDQDLYPFVRASHADCMIHIETSGTVVVDYLDPGRWKWVWVTMCPKPGYKSEMLDCASEIKVIVPGLGNGEGWPKVRDAMRWAETVPVFLQPRNAKFDIDQNNLRVCEELVQQHPNLRLSVQLHKIMKVR